MRIALTQSEGRLAGLAEALVARGHEVLRAPLIRTAAISSETVREEARALLWCPWILFTSPAGVDAWHSLGLPLRDLKTRIGTVGSKTARQVKGYGGHVTLVGDPPRATGLAACFLRHPGAAAPVGLPRGDRARQELQERLEAAGFDTRPAVLYRTVEAPWTLDHPVDAVLLASPSAVEALPDDIGRQATLITLGPSTGQAVQARGWCYTQANAPEAQAVLDALCEVMPCP